MHLYSVLFTASVCLGAALDTRQTPRPCFKVAKRVEWRQLPDQDKKSYLDSVLCMTTKPSRLGLNSTLYDDFPWAHARVNDNIHAVASFLPWHRWFVHLYEEAVRECGYTGSFPYWDWTIDAGNVPNSPIWNAETGFGGNGSPDRVEEGGSQRRQCVDDGPFKNVRPAYFGSGKEDHCLSRTWNAGGNTVGDMMAFAYTKAVVDNIQKLDTFLEYANSLEGRPHGAVHVGIGGDMMPSTSPNDPIFFLHHAQVDRLWTLWQNADPLARESDYEGNKLQNKWDGTTPPAASLDDIMEFSGLSRNLLVREVMTTRTSLLCYEYE
ncbi:Tyrosinase ustQ [Paramyrothecium foliicola]|nr:Tyrosinase ustQ [Paramyrothecium foliicola]